MTTTFATPLELSQYLTGNPATVGELDAAFTRQATILLELISADIEQVAGIGFDFGTGTELIAGTWSRDLEIPRRPVRSVTSVAINGITVSSADFVWNERGLIRKGGASLTDLDEFDRFEDWTRYGMQGASWRSGGHWGGPASTVALEYAWGSDDVPPFLRSMALRTAARIIGNPHNLTQESLAVYSATYAATADDKSGSHLRDADRRRLKKLYSRTSGTGYLGGL